MDIVDVAVAEGEGGAAEEEEEEAEDIITDGDVAKVQEMRTNILQRATLVKTTRRAGMAGMAVLMVREEVPDVVVEVVADQDATAEGPGNFLFYAYSITF